jgi:putative DNA primase/helicase
MRLVKELSKHRQMAISQFETNPKDKLEKLRTALKLEQTPGSKHCLEFAQSLAPFSCLPDALDKDPACLACLNGTLYPQFGFLAASDQNAMITKRLSVAYKETTKAPRWLKFLDEVFTKQNGDPDPDLIGYIQKALGYCLTSYTNERCLFICYGEGANGKPTFINNIDYIMGSYAATITFGNLTDSGGERTGHDLAGLRGVRFLAAIETNQQSYLDEAKVKRLTGGDEPISVRFLYGQYFRYVPTYKIWLACNHKPRIRGTDEAIWDRIKLIPFNNRFSKGSPNTDKELLEKLKTETEGILAWMAQDCIKWSAEGLKDCKTVKDSTHTYRIGEDYFQEFLDENIKRSPGTFTPSEHIWLQHNHWERSNGYTEMPNTNRLGMAMANKGYKSVQQIFQGKLKRGYRDIRLT